MDIDLNLSAWITEIRLPFLHKCSSHWVDNLVQNTFNLWSGVYFT